MKKHRRKLKVEKQFGLEIMIWALSRGKRKS